jgi:ABC-type antimicrobial peptide transport system permease subunit
VTSYLVSQRTRELGIRVALGARSRDIVRTVLGTSVAVAVVGIVIGAVSSIFAGRLLESLLFGIKPYDPRVLGAVALLLVGLSTVANWIPARRAARADPLAALRSE